VAEISIKAVNAALDDSNDMAQRIIETIRNSDPVYVQIYIAMLFCGVMCFAARRLGHRPAKDLIDDVAKQCAAAIEIIEVERRRKSN